MKLAAFPLKTRPRPESSATPGRYRKDRTLPELFNEMADAAPAAVSIIYDGNEIDYQTLDRHSTALARWLVNRSLDHEDLVAIMLPRSAPAIIAMLGTLKAGCAYLPLGDDLPEQRLQQILASSRARILIGPSEQLAISRTLRATCPALEATLVLDRIDPSGLLPNEYDQTALDQYAGTARFDRSRAGDLAYVMYTSGTTGVPKGVMVEHHAILRLVVDTDYIQLSPHDRILQTGAPSFDASTFEIWGALLNGGAVCVPNGDELLDPGALVRLIRDHGITTMFLTTALFNTLTSARPDLPEGLRTLITGGERASPHHINRVQRRYPSLALKNAYGPTENTTFTTMFDIRQLFATDIPIGWPIGHTSVYVLDDALQPVPVGVPGELYVGGDGLARGYLNDPQLTAERFIPSPFAADAHLYRTGDLVKRRWDDAIEFVERIDDQIKIRGFRVEPGEIEHRLAQILDLRQVIVKAFGETADERILVAYYTADRMIPSQELRRHVAQALPEHMVPARFVQLAAMPLTTSGKIDRRALPSPETMPKQAASPEQAMPEQVMNETEQTLLAIWQEALQRDDVGYADNFFELGGYSLKAVRLVHLVETRLGVALPFTIVYEAPTIRAMAARIVEAASTGDAAIDLPLVALTPDSLAPSLYAFPPGTADALSYAEVARRLTTHAIHAFNFTEATSGVDAFAEMVVAAKQASPCCLFGYSGGGNLAFRTALKLEQRGIEVCDIVLLDASRFLDTFDFPPGEAQRLALAFVEADAVRAHLHSAPLRDKIIRRIERYYQTLPHTLDIGQVQANIHLITSSDPNDEYRDDTGRLVSSKRAWADATLGNFSIHSGYGPHERMLLTPHIDGNMQVLTGILTGIARRQQFRA